MAIFEKNFLASLPFKFMFKVHGNLIKRSQKRAASSERFSKVVENPNDSLELMEGNEDRTRFASDKIGDTVVAFFKFGSGGGDVIANKIEISSLCLNFKVMIFVMKSYPLPPAPWKGHNDHHVLLFLSYLMSHQLIGEYTNTSLILLLR